MSDSAPEKAHDTDKRSALYLWIVNALAFQIGWLVCVLGGNFWALIYTLPVLILHFRFFPGGRADVMPIGLALLLGWLHDTGLTWAGVLVFDSGSVFPPPWLWCLWLLMGATLKHSLSIIYDHPARAALVGAIAGPLAYAGGVALSDADWGMPLVNSLAILVILWLFVLPLHRYLTLAAGELCVRIKAP